MQEDRKHTPSYGIHLNTARWRARACVSAAAALLGAVLMSACHGDHAASHVNGKAASADVLPVFTTVSVTGTVTLPVGAALTPEKLQVISTVAKTIPTSAGQFTLDVYDNGPQFAIALSPSGAPALIGWLDATHGQLSAHSTALVMAYYALGGPLIPYDSDRTTLLAAIEQSAGLSALEGVVGSELAANIDAFAQPNSTLTAAVTAYAASINGATQATSATVRMLTARPAGISVTPDQQSGLNVQQDPPFAAHVLNSYRRRTYAFVERVSHGNLVNQTVVDTPDPAPVTDFEVPPVVGVNSGVTGAVSDIFNAYFGNQPTAYATITAPTDLPGTFSIPLVSGSDKTTYQVTIVGPGGSSDNTGVSSLTSAQYTQMVRISVAGFVADALVPFLANYAFGSDLQTGGTGRVASSTLQQFKVNIIQNLEVDILGYLNSTPGLQDKILAGNYKDVMVDMLTTTAGSNTLREFLTSSVEAASAYYASKGWASGTFTAAANSFNVIINAAGGLLQVFDSGIYGAQLANASKVSRWTIAVNKPKVALNPGTTTIDVGGDVSFKVDVPGVDDTTSYSYSWSSTGKVGDLSEVGGGNRRHQTMPPYCSSSNQAIFVYLSGSTPGATDAVAVDVYNGGNCAQGKGQLLGTGTASVTLASNPVGISPQNPQVVAGTTQVFTVKSSDTSYFTGTSFRWVLDRGVDLYGEGRDLCCSAGGIIGVNVAVPASTGTALGMSKMTVVTTDPTIMFAANPFGPEAYGPDFSWDTELTLTVSVLDSTGTLLETSSTPIQTQLPTDIMLP